MYMNREFSYRKRLEMNLNEACKELSVSYNTLRKYIRLGLVKAVKIGKSYRISDDEIERVKIEGIDLSSVKKGMPYING